MKMISIEALRHVYKTVELQTRFTGKDENGTPIYKEPNEVIYPSISFTGSVKLHGTNGSIVIKDGQVVETRSKNKVLSETDDNFGFYKFIRKNAKAFEKWEDGEYFGEFVGIGINSGDAITKMPNSFFVFFKAVNDVILEHTYVSQDIYNVFNINEFPKYQIEIDFNKPIDFYLDAIKQILDEFEKSCPVASEFGIEGYGEGIVWHSEGFKFMFKSKTKAHVETNERPIKVTETQIDDKLVEFCSTNITKARVEKALATGLIYPNQMKDIIFWILEDLKKEESEMVTHFGEKNLLKQIPIFIKQVLK